MIELPVYDRQGQVVETLNFDESCLGKFVNMQLLHRAVVMFEANQRSGTHSTKNRRSVTGTGAKPFRQKGTGRARQGSKRRVGSPGGAIAHGPQPRDYSKDMPKKERRLALKSALLGKFRDGEVKIISELKQEAPRTREVAGTLKALEVAKGCLIVAKERDENLWLSVRNISYTDLAPLSDLNAYNVLKRKQLVITKEALEAISEEMK